MKATVVLTICSANYLAQAKTLGDSLTAFNPQYRFVIGLVDRVADRIDHAFWAPHELIEVESVGIPGFNEMCSKYTLVELNTAVKPFLMQHLYAQHPEVDAVLYFDPDIMVFRRLDDLDAKLREHSIILTPHSCTPLNDAVCISYELAMLRTGTYNLGFVATSRGAETSCFLDWWKTRLKDYCFYRPGAGLFVDQMWANLVPLYFARVHVEKSPGYNMCYWNHFERHVSMLHGSYMVNASHELAFYHFSSFDPRRPEVMASRGFDRPLAQRPDLRPIFEEYRARLIANGHDRLIGLPCAFGTREPARAPQHPVGTPGASRGAVRCWLRAATKGVGHVFRARSRDR